MHESAPTTAPQLAPLPPEHVAQLVDALVPRLTAAIAQPGAAVAPPTPPPPMTRLDKLALILREFEAFGTQGLFPPRVATAFTLLATVVADVAGVTDQLGIP